MRFQNKKEKWIAVVGLLNGRPYEIFTGKTEDVFNMPAAVEYGWIIKNKRITVNNLNGLSTHSIKPIILSTLVWFLGSGLGSNLGSGAGIGAGLVLGVERLTAATFAGALTGALAVFLAVTIQNPYQYKNRPKNGSN